MCKIEPWSSLALPGMAQLYSMCLSYSSRLARTFSLLCQRLKRRNGNMEANTLQVSAYIKFAKILLVKEWPLGDLRGAGCYRVTGYWWPLSEAIGYIHLMQWSNANLRNGVKRAVSDRWQQSGGSVVTSQFLRAHPSEMLRLGLGAHSLRSYSGNTDDELELKTPGLDPPLFFFFLQYQLCAYNDKFPKGYGKNFTLKMLVLPPTELPVSGK